jgi:hypothetical protein
MSGSSDVSPQVDDPIVTYLSVFAALGHLREAPILGEVLNGVEDEQDVDDEFEEVEEDADVMWGKHLGNLLAYTAQYSAFACEGSAPSCTTHIRGFDVVSTVLYLRVRREGAVVASWPLNEPLPVSELLAYCTPAPFGDLRTQNTVIDAAVRTAMELPVSC